MAEDRFANVFTATVLQSGANALTFAEMNFGLNLRDRVAIVIDELYWYLASNMYGLMTVAADLVSVAVTVSDQVTDIQDMADRRIIFQRRVLRADWGTAASGGLVLEPFKDSFSPPIIILPTRVFIGIASAGLASATGCTLRMHYRTVSLTADQQLLEVLETFQMST